MEMVTLTIAAAATALTGVLLARIALERVTSLLRSNVVRTRRETSLNRRG